MRDPGSPPRPVARSGERGCLPLVARAPVADHGSTATCRLAVYRGNRFGWLVPATSGGPAGDMIRRRLRRLTFACRAGRAPGPSGAHVPGRAESRSPGAGARPAVGAHHITTSARCGPVGHPAGQRPCRVRRGVPVWLPGAVALPGPSLPVRVTCGEAGMRVSGGLGGVGERGFFAGSDAEEFPSSRWWGCGYTTLAAAV